MFTHPNWVQERAALGFSRRSGPTVLSQTSQTLVLRASRCLYFTRNQLEARLVRDYACLCDRPRKGFNNEDDTGNPSLNTSHRAVTVAYPSVNRGLRQWFNSLCEHCRSNRDSLWFKLGFSLSIFAFSNRRVTFGLVSTTDVLNVVPLLSLPLSSSRNGTTQTKKISGRSGL